MITARHPSEPYLSYYSRYREALEQRDRALEDIDEAREIARNLLAELRARYVEKWFLKRYGQTLPKWLLAEEEDPQ